MPALGDPDNDKETTVGRFVFRATVITLADVRRRLSHGNSSLLVQRLDKVRGISVAIVRQNFDTQKSSTLCDALQRIEPTRNEANDNARIWRRLPERRRTSRAHSCPPAHTCQTS
jgi:hypothetical protein